jgi:hypothetical protein
VEDETTIKVQTERKNGLKRPLKQWIDQLQTLRPKQNKRPIHDTEEKQLDTHME